VQRTRAPAHGDASRQRFAAFDELQLEPQLALPRRPYIGVPPDAQVLHATRQTPARAQRALLTLQLLRAGAHADAGHRALAPRNRTPSLDTPDLGPTRLRTRRAERNPPLLDVAPKLHERPGGPSAQRHELAKAHDPAPALHEHMAGLLGHHTEAGWPRISSRIGLRPELLPQSEERKHEGDTNERRDALPSILHDSPPLRGSSWAPIRFAFLADRVPISFLDTARLPGCQLASKPG
jgi:hypothetical protein